MSQKRKDAIVIQLDANKWTGILKFSQTIQKKDKVCAIGVKKRKQKSKFCKEKTYKTLAREHRRISIYRFSPPKIAFRQKETTVGITYVFSV